MPLRTCANGHQYEAKTLWARPSNDGLCSACRQAAASARYHRGEKGRAAVARYRQSEKGKATWRKQDERRRALRAQKRAELAPAPQLLPGMRLCLKRLHQYDPTIARKKNGRATCPECRRASRARYRRSERGRAVRARYFQSEKGQAAQARYLRKRKQRGDPSDTT